MIPRTRIINVALVVLSGLLAFVVLETVLRISYVKPWHLSLLEPQEIPRQPQSPTKNSFGLRDKEYLEIPKTQNCRRVLFLGDSFTYGSGVQDDTAVFPRLLENQLNTALGGSGPTIEILNGGIPGSLTGQWLGLLIRLMESFRPDVVLIVFFLRDGTRVGSMPHFFVPIREELQKKDLSFFYKHSYLFRFYRDQQDMLNLSRKYCSALNESYLGTPEQTREWEVAKANILKIRDLCEAQDVKVGFVVFPVLVELNSQYPFKYIYDLILGFGIKNDIPSHGLLPAFYGKSGPELWVSSRDQHPNAKGHQIAADSILPFLLGMLAEPPQLHIQD